jgi:membrane-associated phospholipid phosphatase
MTIARGRTADPPDTRPRRRGGGRPIRSRGPVLLAALAFACYVLLAVLVAREATASFDAAARGFFRPDNEWGPLQLRADVVVEGLKPRTIAVLFPLAAAVVALHRRSWRPVLYAAAISCLTAAATLLTKLALRRPDTHDVVTQHGGSFPSGHTVTMLVAIGALLLMVRVRTRWWQWTPVVLAGLTMGFCLLVQAAHWFTDVVGGLLLGVAVLAAVSVWPLREPSRDDKG